MTAQIAVSTAQKGVSDTTLVAPAAGTVSTVNGAVGEAVASGGTTAFITLVNLSTLQVKAAFSETDAAKRVLVRLRRSRSMRPANQTFTGKVVAYRRDVDGHEQRRDVHATTALDSASPLVKEGMTATVDVTVAEKDGVLVLPRVRDHGAGPNGHSHGADRER